MRKYLCPVEEMYVSMNACNSTYLKKSMPPNPEYVYFGYIDKNKVDGLRDDANLVLVNESHGD